ncbi:MAG: IS1595 family transposase [Bacteroidetes bacterium]|nr:IS1595 family transposase [Bacteroidota bacterium]
MKYKKQNILRGICFHWEQIKIKFINLKIKTMESQKNENRKVPQVINTQGDFGTRDKCNEVIFMARTTEDCKCPGCSRKVRDVYRPRQNRNEYMCRNCYSVLTLYSGTIFEASNIPIEYWFYTLQQVFDNSFGITSKKLEKRLNVSVKTALYMLFKIRTALKELNPKTIAGEFVECDEVFPKTGTGGFGKDAGQGSGNKERTSPVAVLACRETGHVIAKVVLKIDSTLRSFVVKHVPRGGTILTDGNIAYRKLIDEGMEYKHFSVKHPSVGKRNGQWVLGIASTNRCENFNSFLKTMHRFYRFVSAKHVQGYVDELVFRFNHRHDDTKMMETFLDSLSNAEIKERKNFRGRRFL